MLTLIQHCERHRYLQSCNILSDNIPIKSYRESFQRTEENMFTKKQNEQRRKKNSFSSQEQKDEMLIFFFVCGEHSTATAASLCWSCRQKQAARVTKRFRGHITFSLESENLTTFCQRLTKKKKICDLSTDWTWKPLMLYLNWNTRLIKTELNWGTSESTVHLSYTAPLNAFVKMKLFMLCSTTVSVNVYSKESMWIYCGTNRQQSSAWRHVNRYNTTGCLKSNYALNTICNCERISSYIKNLIYVVMSLVVFLSNNV